MRRFHNILSFYRSTLAINLAVSIIPLFVLNVEASFFLFTTFGYVASIAIKEVNNEENYLFYYNNGLSKIQLWVYGTFLNFITVLIIFLITVLIMKLFR